VPQFYLLPKSLVKRWPGLRNAAWWLEGRLFGALLGLAERLPPERSGRLLAALFGWLGPHTAKAAKVDANLRFVCPAADARQRRAMVKRVFRHLGLATAELLAAPRLLAERASRFEFEVDPRSAELLARRQPALWVTAHLGAWHLNNALVPEYGLEASYLYAREANPHLHDLFYRLRKIPGIHLYPNSGGLLRLQRELKAGRNVGLLIDTRLDEGEPIPLFGVPAPTNTLAARLALRAGVPLVTLWTERLPGYRYRVHVEAPVVPPAGVDDDGARALAMTAEMNRRFESWIRRDPTQWMCLKRRWPKAAQPAPAAG
jgi:Kdo2-lipid IVA lauroyltransferase/acyltransferase